MSCFVATGALSSRRKHGFRGGVVRLLGVELRLPVLLIPKAEFNYQDSWAALAGIGEYCRRSALASVWLTRPNEAQENLACANCMASASDTFAWHPRSPRAGLAPLAFALAVARHPCSGRAGSRAGYACALHP